MNINVTRSSRPSASSGGTGSTNIRATATIGVAATPAARMLLSRSANATAEAAAATNRIRWLITANLVLGLLTIAVAAFA